MKTTKTNLEERTSYESPQVEVIRVAIEANIMSYGDPNAPGGALPEYSGDPYSI